MFARFECSSRRVGSKCIFIPLIPYDTMPLINTCLSLDVVTPAAKRTCTCVTTTAYCLSWKVTYYCCATYKNETAKVEIDQTYMFT